MLVSLYNTVFLSNLLQVSQWYELVVFTASMEIYGSAVADKLDNSRSILKRRYYRQVRIRFERQGTHWEVGVGMRGPVCYIVLCFQHCTLELGSYIKDLSVVHSDLSSIVILDNSPGAYRSHPGMGKGLSGPGHTSKDILVWVLFLRQGLLISPRLAWPDFVLVVLGVKPRTSHKS